jgi:cell division septum initiation protein DivIVA
MSAYEPDPATSGGEGDSTRPRFQLARRGYDRQQVDRYVMELIALIEQQHQRAEHAERLLEQARSEMDERGERQPPSFVHLGVEAGKVLEQAGASAEAIITEARARGRSLVEDAEGQAAEVVQEAEQRAGELEQAAREMLEEAESRRANWLHDAEQAASEARRRADEEARTVLAEARDATNLVWQESQQERTVVEAETTRLQAFRQEMLEHLSDVQARLSELLADARGLAEPVQASEPQPVQDELFAAGELEDGETTAAMAPDGEAGEEATAEHSAPLRPAEQAPTRSP